MSSNLCLRAALEKEKEHVQGSWTKGSFSLSSQREKNYCSGLRKSMFSNSKILKKRQNYNGTAVVKAARPKYEVFSFSRSMRYVVY